MRLLLLRRSMTKVVMYGMRRTASVLSVVHLSLRCVVETDGRQGIDP